MFKIRNSKPEIIFKKLQDAGDEGVLEVDLFMDMEKRGNTRVLKYKVLNDIIGDVNAITIRAGRWYLSEEYFEMTMSKFLQDMNRYFLDQMATKFIIATIAIIAIFVAVMPVMWTTGFIAGLPDSLQECKYIFEEK